ncbi:MAG TPA: dihydrodipicolinate synthase family protein [Gemmatimonadaceae bacterium]|nr:dihydrodipicolinate synthase family protein [Gemmatimonadaceae bacterium]
MAASDRERALRASLGGGVVIPAHPLALTAERRLDERHQRALTRYYLDAGAGGIAVGVHTTQFAIRNPEHGLYRPVLELAAETARGWRNPGGASIALVAGAIGDTAQAVADAEIAASLGYDLVLLSLGALRDASDAALIAHCRTVGEVLPLFGFYLQPAVGGRVLGYRFWREFAEIERAWAIKIAPFDRYRTLDVVRAVADSGRTDLALYTGNDDAIVSDLVTPFPVGGAASPHQIVGGLLGQWAVWTHAAVQLLERARAVRASGAVNVALLRDGAALTDANAAIFDAANAFAGCIPGIHEVLRRQGLLRGTWCLDPHEELSRGQAEEISRVIREHPELTDDRFVSERLEGWLRP